MKSFILGLILGFFLAPASVQAEEFRFVFDTNPPQNLPRDMAFLYSLESVVARQITVNVDVPGVPVVSEQELIYVIYTGLSPYKWGVYTFLWPGEADCSVVHAHIAALKGTASPYDLYHQLFRLGFKRAVIQLGLAPCQSLQEDKLYFKFNGVLWKLSHLEEAVGELGVILLASILKDPEAVENRFAALHKKCSDEQALTCLLLQRAERDRLKYRRELGLVVQAFLDQNLPVKPPESSRLLLNLKEAD